MLTKPAVLCLKKFFKKDLTKFYKCDIIIYIKGAVWAFSLLLALVTVGILDFFMDNNFFVEKTHLRKLKDFSQKYIILCPIKRKGDDIMKKKKSSVRDAWIPQSWRYNGAGYQKNKKKNIPRKQKHKEKFY